MTGNVAAKVFHGASEIPKTATFAPFLTPCLYTCAFLQTFTSWPSFKMTTLPSFYKIRIKVSAKPSKEIDKKVQLVLLGKVLEAKYIHKKNTDIR